MKRYRIPAETIIKRFGGIENTKLYLAREGNFQGLFGVDSEINNQIRELIGMGRQENHSKIKPVILDPHSAYSLDLVREYERLKDSCSFRTVRILQKLELDWDYEAAFDSKIFFVDAHFFQPYDFMAIRHSGKITVSQIQRIIDSLQKLHKQLKRKKNDSQEITIPFDPTKHLISQDTVQTYESLKTKCRVRTINVLLNLEDLEGYHESDIRKIEFIERLFFGTANYRAMKNSGSKTETELIGVRNALWKYVLHEKQPEQTDSPIIIKNILEKYLSTFFPFTISDDLKTSEKFSVQKVICVLLTKLHSNHKIGASIHYYLNSNLSYDEIANKIGCSRETVRVSVKKLTELILPKLVTNLHNHRDFLELENVLHGDSNTLLVLKPIEGFHFNKEEYVTSFIRDKLVLKEFLRDSHLLLNELPLLEKSESEVFDIQRQYYFIKEDMAKEANISGLLDFLEHEISTHESVHHAYNLTDLINRFYTESGIIVTTEVKEVLFMLIQKIKIKTAPADPVKIEKLKKIEKSEEITWQIEYILRGSQKGLNLKAIKGKLDELKIEIPMHQLFYLLSKSPQKFGQFGYGKWILKETFPEKEAIGSVREITQKLLQKSDPPLHISEILTFIQGFRPISAHSLITNLKLSENIHFHFFACGYIGLKNKKYDANWYQIPTFSPARFGIIKRKDHLSIEEKIRLLVELGYPRIHCEYLLQRKKQD